MNHHDVTRVGLIPIALGVADGMNRLHLRLRVLLRKQLQSRSRHGHQLERWSDTIPRHHYDLMRYVSDDSHDRAGSGPSPQTPDPVSHGQCRGHVRGEIAKSMPIARSQTSLWGAPVDLVGGELIARSRVRVYPLFALF
jgi:hypothetical protein